MLKGDGGRVEPCDAPLLPGHQAQRLEHLLAPRFRVRRLLPAEGRTRPHLSGKFARGGHIGLGSILASNQVHVAHTLSLIRTTGQGRVGLFGLSFKEGTEARRRLARSTAAHEAHPNQQTRAALPQVHGIHHKRPAGVPGRRQSLTPTSIYCVCWRCMVSWYSGDSRSPQNSCTSCCRKSGDSRWFPSPCCRLRHRCEC